LTDKQLALACASHSSAKIHVDAVDAWLKNLGLADADFRCGPQEPRDLAVRDALIRAYETPCQIHNECSGKHTGFLTLNQYLKGGADYEKIDHPVQQACKAALEETSGVDSSTYGIDGCSAPNFATTLHGLARSMSFFASAHTRNDTRSLSAARLTQAMMTFPEMVAGEGRVCTDLMRAMGGKAAMKTGADGVCVAILPEKRLGIAIKIADGSTYAREIVIAAILVKLGVLHPDHPATKAYMTPDITNRRGLKVGYIRPTTALNQGIF
jgi:L-asparaginase II